MSEKELSWQEVRKKMKFTPEEEYEIRLEEDIIEATIAARKKAQLTQRELSAKCGIKQPNIAKIESRKRSPQVDTLMKILFAMGYTLRVVPLDEKE